MDITMPATFPASDFEAFGMAVHDFPPKFPSYEYLKDAMDDPLEKKRQFEWAWQAVRYRYRSCAECRDEFKALLGNAGEMWKQTGLSDEELTYKLERCIYLFFMSGLSVFDSFAFCLYFVGHALQPGAFPDVGNPRAIKRKSTTRAFKAEFPQAAITSLLAGLQDDTRFITIDVVRNVVGHRISGRRTVRGGTSHADGVYTHWREETWHLPGTVEKLTFDDDLLQRHLDDITGLLTPLASAAREFVESNKPAEAQP